MHVQFRMVEAARFATREDQRLDMDVPLHRHSLSVPDRQLSMPIVDHPAYRHFQHHLRADRVPERSLHPLDDRRRVENDRLAADQHLGAVLSLAEASLESNTNLPTRRHRSESTVSYLSHSSASTRTRSLLSRDLHGQTHRSHVE